MVTTAAEDLLLLPEFHLGILLLLLLLLTLMMCSCWLPLARSYRCKIGTTIMEYGALLGYNGKITDYDYSFGGFRLLS